MRLFSVSFDNTAPATPTNVRVFKSSLFSPDFIFFLKSVPGGESVHTSLFQSFFFFKKTNLKEKKIESGLVGKKSPPRRHDYKSEYIILPLTGKEEERDSFHLVFISPNYYCVCLEGQEIKKKKVNITSCPEMFFVPIAIRFSRNEKS